MLLFGKDTHNCLLCEQELLVMMNVSRALKSIPIVNSQFQSHLTSKGEFLNYILHYDLEELFKKLAKAQREN